MTTTPVPPETKPGDLIVTRVIAEKKPQGYRAALDHPSANTVLHAGEPLRLKGWVIDPEQVVPAVRVIRESDESEVVRFNTGLARRGVAVAFPQILHAATSGFDGRIEQLQPGCYRVEGVGPKRHYQPIFRLALRDPAAKPAKLLFMHIAKTGGSSVNRFLADSVGSRHCAFHIESDDRWRQPERSRELEAKTVISGHITQRNLSRRLDLTEYVKVTILRNPIDHLISHLAYIRRLSEPSEIRRLEVHSPSIQAFSAKLAATDFTDRKTVKSLITKLLPEERWLVDNCQTRYLSNVAPHSDVDRASLIVARDTVQTFDVVGFTENMEGFLRSIATRMDWRQPKAIPQENGNDERYGLDPANADIRAVLDPLIHFDEGLYRFARKIYIDGNPEGAERVKKRNKAAVEAQKAQGLTAV